MSAFSLPLEQFSSPRLRPVQPSAPARSPEMDLPPLVSQLPSHLDPSSSPRAARGSPSGVCVRPASCPNPPGKAPIPEVLLELKCLQCTLCSSNALRARPPGAHAPWEDRPFHRLSGAPWDSGSRAGPSPRNPSEDGPTLSPLLPPRGALLSCENCPPRGG